MNYILFSFDNLCSTSGQSLIRLSKLLKIRRRKNEHKIRRDTKDFTGTL